MTKKPMTVPGAVDTLIATLHAGDPVEALADARRVAGAMDQRPWEQLPGRLKSAIRADIRRLMDGGADEAGIHAAGYSSRISRAARRDLGLGG